MLHADSFANGGNPVRADTDPLGFIFDSENLPIYAEVYSGVLVSVACRYLE